MVSPLVIKAFNRLLLDYKEVIEVLGIQPFIFTIKDLLKHDNLPLAKLLLENYSQQKKAEINSHLLLVRNESKVAYKLSMKLLSALQLSR